MGYKNVYMLRDKTVAVNIKLKLNYKLTHADFHWMTAGKDRQSDYVSSEAQIKGPSAMKAESWPLWKTGAA